MACERFGPLTPGALASERQPMDPAGAMTEGLTYFINCTYSDTGELAYSDYFVYTPGAEEPAVDAIARRMAANMPLTYPVPVTAPGIDADQLVGLPTWLWVDPASWEPVELSQSLGPMTITVTAEPTRVEWALGDDSVTCHGPGTPWHPDGHDDQQTDCSYTFQHVSPSVAGTATVVWDVSYTATGYPRESLGENSSATAFDLTVTERQAVVCYADCT